jgi:hypothetical protein
MRKADFLRAVTVGITTGTRAKTEGLMIMPRHQGIRQRIAESQRKAKSDAKRSRRLARRNAKRKQQPPSVAMNREIDLAP